MKKNTFAFFALIVTGLFSLFTITGFAQKADSVKIEEPGKTCGGKFVMPQTVAVDNEAFENYLKLALMPLNERRKSFGKLLNGQKADFIKVNLALQFVKRPNMTKDQQDFVLESLSRVSADLFDTTNPEKARRSEESGMEMMNKALGLFALKDVKESGKDVGDFIEPLGTPKNEEAAFLQKYEDILKNGSKSRMKIAKEMPVNDRVNIWKVQFAFHLATGKFSKAQNEFILEMLNSLSPETFATRMQTKEEETKANELLLSRIFGVFTKEEGFAIFMTIGIQKYVKDEPVIVASLKPACECLFYCPGPPTCGGANSCDNTDDGCGPMGGFSCRWICIP